MSVFQMKMEKKPIKSESGEVTIVTERKIIPIYVDSGEEVDGEPVGSIKLKVVETKIDVQAYINSFADQCGVKNVMRRFAMTGDPTLFAQHQVIENVDATKLPDKSSEELFASLPEEITKGKTYEEFVKGLTAEQYIALMQGIVTKYESNQKKDEVTE